MTDFAVARRFVYAACEGVLAEQVTRLRAGMSSRNGEDIDAGLCESPDCIFDEIYEEQIWT